MFLLCDKIEARFLIVFDLILK